MAAPRTMGARSTLTCVAVVCDGAFPGHAEELRFLVQSFLLPLTDLGSAYASRLGGRRLLELWVAAATFRGVALAEYNGDALFEAIQRSGGTTLEKAIGEGAISEEKWEELALVAATAGAKDVLELVVQRNPAAITTDTFDVVARSGDVTLMEWLLDQCPSRSVTSYGVEDAASLGHVEMLQLVLRKELPDSVMNVRIAVTLAIRNGYGGIVQWIRDSFPPERWIGEAIDEAVIQGRKDLARELLAWGAPWHPLTLQGRYSNRVLDHIFETGDVATLNCLYEHGLLDRVGEFPFAMAKFHGHMSVLAFVDETFPGKFAQAMAFTVKDALGGSVEVAQWAHARGQLVRSLGCVYNAAKNGHIEFIRWYVDTMDGAMEFYPNYHAVFDAAANGHLSCVQFLVEHGWGEVTQGAVDRAASTGNLELVHWLVTNCYQHVVLDGAIANAADQGHLDVVTWLFRHGARSSKQAVGRAAKQGHADVVQWLILHISNSDTVQALKEAVRAGCLRIVRLLPWHPATDCDTLVSLAHTYGHKHVAKWIDRYGRLRTEV